MSRLRELKIASDKITNRSNNTSRYFSDVEKRKMLSPDEEFKIGILAQAGDEKAINKLIDSNLRFVISVAKQYSTGNVSLDELICQGNLGLIHAARTFDPTRGFKFISYAVWHIRKEILFYFTTNHRAVRIPQNILTMLSQIKKVEESILQNENRSATIAEIQEALADDGKIFSEDQIKRFLQSDGVAVALETSDIEDAKSPIDWLSSESSASDVTDQNDMAVVVTKLLASLEPVPREIVSLRLGINGREPESFSSIASKFDRTPEWARSIYTKAIRRLKGRYVVNAASLNLEYN
jgi:RNA polymerase primary sigma factor